MQRLVLFFSLTTCFSLSMSAQDRASINGVVTDSSNAVVAGASVELLSSATGLRRATVSSTHGLYEFTALPVGSYTPVFTAGGFTPIKIQNLELQYGETRTIDVKLEVGGVTENVTVNAAAEALNRTNPEVAGVIESAQIKEIPVL